MIKSFIFENFKSFEKAELNLEALTSLIGTNSSGKSNAIEGIHILADTATGLELGTILDGTRNMDSHIRGGSKSCCRFKTSAFKLGCLIDLDEKYDLYYYIKISTNKKVWVEEVALYKVVNGKTELAGGEKIFKTKLRSKVISRRNIMIKRLAEIQTFFVCGFLLFWHSLGQSFLRTRIEIESALAILSWFWKI